jgi:hypothetical protein
MDLPEDPHAKAVFDGRGDHLDDWYRVAQALPFREVLELRGHDFRKVVFRHRLQKQHLMSEPLEKFRGNRVRQASPVNRTWPGLFGVESNHGFRGVPTRLPCACTDDENPGLQFFFGDVPNDCLAPRFVGFSDEWIL